jgi:Ni,Fe-hydrogenase III large subunit
MAVHKRLDEPSPAPLKENKLKLAPNALAISLVEGWRGEIAHCAITDHAGQIVHYKVKDPSMHNWMALALSLRDLEISDFPINNKSYNLSYCGHDL